MLISHHRSSSPFPFVFFLTLIRKSFSWADQSHGFEQLSKKKVKGYDTIILAADADDQISRTSRKKEEEEMYYPWTKQKQTSVKVTEEISMKQCTRCCKIKIKTREKVLNS